MLTKARIKLVRSLSDKAARSENGLFVAEGRKMVGEALAAGADIERIYLTGGCIAGELDEALRRGIAERVADSEMERMSHLKTPSDILAVIRMPADGGEAAFPAGELSLCLDGVQDPGNLGTIIRIADWFGIGKVFCSPDSADCYNPKAVQATMGALFRVSVGYGPLDAALAEAAARGEAVYGTFLEGDDLYRAELSGGGVIVMGSEGRGISPQAAALVNRKLFIPPFPPGRHGSESLNVAAATAIVCAEFRRRVRTAR